MATYSSITRMTGLSGIDTESLVTQLMRAESMKYDKLKKANQMLIWKQESYRNTASSIEAFQKSYFNILSKSSLTLSSNFKSFNVSVKNGATDSTAISVKRSENAKVGSYKIQVDKLAAKETYTATSREANVITSGSINPADIKKGDSFIVNFDNDPKVIIIDEELTGADDAAKLEHLKNILQKNINIAYGKEATSATDPTLVNKINVTLDGDKLSFQTNSSGHTLGIYDNFSRPGYAITSKNNMNDSRTPGTYTFDVTTGDTTKSLSFDVAIGDSKEDVVKKIQAQIKDKGLSDSLSVSLNNGKITFAAIATTQEMKIKATGSKNLFDELGFNEHLVGVPRPDTEDPDYDDYDYVEEITLDRASSLEGLKIKQGQATTLDLNKNLNQLSTWSGSGVPTNGVISLTKNGKEYTIEYDATKSIATLMKDINESGAGFTLSFDNFSREFKLEAKETGTKGKLDSLDPVLEKLFGFKKPVVVPGDPPTETPQPAGTSYTSGSDAMFTYNGVTTTRTSNTFILDGIDFTLNEVTEASSTITVNIERDIETPMQTIKDFVSAYNKLIDEINTLTSTSKAKQNRYSGYEPLTDEEKAAMTENQIKLWEDKAKEGIMYNDPILSSFTSGLRSMIYEPVKLSDGSTMSLHELGITTGNYFDKGKLIIDETKLERALSEKGDKIAEFFTKSGTPTYSTTSSNAARRQTTGLGERLEDHIKDYIGHANSRFQREAGVKGGYTDSENVLSNEIKAYANKLDDMLSYLVDKENYYYSMFAKMEAAMTQSNNQMAYLQAQFGG